MTELDKAVLEAAARAMCVKGGFDPDKVMANDGPLWRYYVLGAEAAISAYLSTTSAGVTEEQVGTFADGIKAAVKFVRKRLDDYVAEHGMYDPETGVTEFPGNGDETVCEWEEIIEGLEALNEVKP